MVPGIFAKTFAGADPATVLGQVKAAGFATAQYNLACSGLPAMPDQIAPGIARAVADAARGAVPICAVSGTYNMIHPDPAERARGLSRLAILAGACADLGTDTITLCTGTNHPTDQWAWHCENASPASWAMLCAEMAKAVAIAQAHGLYMGIEPELANVVADAACARRLLDEMQSDRLTIILDPANLFETAETPREIIARAVDLLADRIGMAHAKDRHPDGSFATAGQGVIDFPDFLARLKAVGFSGPVIAHGLPEGDAPRVARFLSDIMAGL